MLVRAMTVGFIYSLRFIILCLVTLISSVSQLSGEALSLGNHRELFCDYYLIDQLKGARLMLHETVDEGPVLQFDQPWEGPFCAYCTVIADRSKFRVYYRGKREAKKDGIGEVTCVAESSDGIHWTKPQLGIVEYDGSRKNNIVYAADYLSHNFSPFVDKNPAADPAQKYKALGGTMGTGLVAFTSPDGLHWMKLRDAPVLTGKEIPFPSGFDSQNEAFWSPTEQRYLMFFRANVGGIRRIARAESHDFVNWTNIVLMQYRGADGKPTVIDQLYINQTHPYFRAPQIYVGLAARFMAGRQAISEEAARAIHVHPKYFKDTSDAVLLTSRGGDVYDRTFLSAFIRPGIGAHNWVSRTTYPALNVVQTSPTEMSIYANQDYAQPTSHLQRYSLRLDGFASVRAPYEGGELITKPFTFKGNHLFLNFATSAAGGIRIELQDESGKPVTGYSLADSVELIGNEIERLAKWKGGGEVGSLAGEVVRLRCVMKDADLYSIRFGNQKRN